MDLEKNGVNKHTNTRVTMSMLKSTAYTKTVSGAAQRFCMQSDIIEHWCLYVDEAEWHQPQP